LMARVPQTEYTRYADAHWRELTEHIHQPAVMWSEAWLSGRRNPQLFAQYYNTVPEGVINNRFGVPTAGFHACPSMRGDMNHVGEVGELPRVGL